VTLGSDRDALRDAVLGAGGAIVSEYNPGTKACAERFPARNRIISGLSDAVVVIEAPARSGALITAEFALEQGREVLAVPGGIYAGTSEGCNQLIKDGAAVVARPTDVAEAIGLGPSASGRAAQLRLAGGLDDTRSDPPGGAKDTESTVFGALRQGQTAFEEIVAQTGIEPVECARALGMLEIRGLCRRHPDGSYEIT
jgi:DNA processing protein